MTKCRNECMSFYTGTCTCAAAQPPSAPSASDVLYIRCMKHRNAPQYNANAAGGAECPVCEIEARQGCPKCEGTPGTTYYGGQPVRCECSAPSASAESEKREGCRCGHPDNDFRKNLEALKTLQDRMHQISGMDVTSFQYQQAIQQITAQEQGERAAPTASAESGVQTPPDFWEWSLERQRGWLWKRLAEMSITNVYPQNCHLCEKQIESKDDLDWHGLGNCVEICSRCNGSGEEPAPTASERMTPEEFYQQTEPGDYNIYTFKGIMKFAEAYAAHVLAQEAKK